MRTTGGDEAWRPSTADDAVRVDDRLALQGGALLPIAEPVHRQQLHADCEPAADSKAP